MKSITLFNSLFDQNEAFFLLKLNIYFIVEFHIAIFVLFISILLIISDPVYLKIDFASFPIDLYQKE
jgi:hypothetical protein